MGDTVRSLGMLMIGVLLAVLVGAAGIISFDWPWNVDNVLSVDQDIVVEEPATVFAIEPISLDCRARVHAEVPVEGRREHRALGQVYRTDTVRLTAIGDVDTCVDSSQVEITESADGRFIVTVPASAIEFVRPRVDMVRTAESVEVDKGFVGKVTDVFPWVGEGNSLTTSAYAYAQSVIGGSECMRAAYSATSTMLRQAYQDQLAEQGGDPGAVSVRIQGTPDFDANDVAELGGVELEVTGDGVSCSVADNAVDSDDPSV